MQESRLGCRVYKLLQYQVFDARHRCHAIFPSFTIGFASDIGAISSDDEELTVAIQNQGEL